MTRRQIYRVTAGRSTGGQWVFQCSEYPRAVSRGNSLADAFDLMPAEIATVAGVHPTYVEIDLVPDCAVVPLDDAKATLPELVAESAGHEIYLTSNHQAVAVLIGSNTYEQLVEHLKELEESVLRAQSIQADEGRTFTPAVYDN